MKKNLFYLFALICSISLFTGCSDSDDDVKFPLDTDVAGVYKGELSVSLEGSVTKFPQNVTLTESGKNMVTLELKNFQFMGIPVGTILVQNCAVTKEGDTYSFTGEQTLDLSSVGLGKCPVKVQKGVIKGDKLDLDLTVNTSVPIELTIGVGFLGTKLKGTESSEAKIETFSFESEFVVEQPIINEANGVITFKVSGEATDDQLKLTPVMTISPKATVTPAIGEVQDFSKGAVTYTVISENGIVKTYEVSIAGVHTSVMKYSFEGWTDALGGKYVYYNPLPADELDTPNKGVALLYSFGKYTGEYPVLIEEEGVSGKGIKLVTRYTKTTSTIPPTITAGTLFTGVMDISFASLTKPLEATHFGIPFTKKPVSFKGYYKYTPGDVFRDGTDKGDVIVEGKTDQCAIKAVLYKVENADEYLDGTNIDTSDKRVAVAQLEDGSAKAEFTPFNLSFEFLEGKEYDPTASYKLAIICTASKEGDAFKGAPDSVLILDELEVIGE